MNKIKVFLIDAQLELKGGDDTPNAKLKAIADYEGALIVELDVSPIDPLSSDFGGFQNEKSERVKGSILFAKEDAAEVIRRALAPHKRRIEAELAMIEKIEALLHG